MMVSTLWQHLIKSSQLLPFINHSQPAGPFCKQLDSYICNVIKGADNYEWLKSEDSSSSCSYSVLEFIQSLSLMWPVSWTVTY